VVEDEENAEVPAQTLQCVAEVILMLVVLKVPLASGGVVDAEDAVERDGKPEGDLGEEEVRDLGVDPSDFVGEVLNAAFGDTEPLALTSATECKPAPRERGVGDQVDHQEDPDR